VTASSLKLFVEEDQLTDPERWHIDEQVAYLVFDQPDDQTSAPKLNTGAVANVWNTQWTTVTLNDTYDSMVVVASAQYDLGDVPLVTRIRNASGNSFDVRVQRADGTVGTINDVTVHYTVVEEGVYTQSVHGVTMEAVKFNSSRTDSAPSSWQGTPRDYQQAYSQPVVVGQVMSSNDDDFSVFWARGADAGSIPSSDTLYVGKHVGGHTDQTRADEQIGYIVIEAGNGSLDGATYAAGVGPNTVVGPQGGTSATYPLSGLSSAGSAVVSSAGMNGIDGSWPILAGDGAVSPAALRLFVEEDQVGDAERWHTAEQVAYLVFEHDGTPLRAEQTAAGVTSLNAPSVVTQTEAELLAEQALEAWRTVLDVAPQLDLDVSVADLPGNVLGLANGTSVVLDGDAAGIGWFVDDTPEENSEFDAVAGRSSLVANPDSPAAERYDLLTVLAHEVGHTLGLDHAGTDQLMSETLEPGIRRLPVESASLELLGEDVLDDLVDDVAGAWNG
jgi:hypothetical protein